MADLAGNGLHPQPPFNRAPHRIRDARGGPIPEGLRRTLAPGMDNESTRFSGVTNDTTIQRDKGPWIPVDNLRGAATGWYDWTAAGPPRVEIHQRNITLRTMQGNSRTRQLQNPRDPWLGLHSTPAPAKLRSNAKFLDPKNPRMRKPRQDRLSNARYTGQSFSSTTRTQGGV